MNKNKSFRYHFTNTDSKLGEVGFKPILPLTLIYQETAKKTSGLLDTGASVNVLPYSLGVELGSHFTNYPPILFI